MTIDLSKALALIDHRRGFWLRLRKSHDKGQMPREKADTVLNVLNNLKKELSNLSDADQIPLGL